MNTQYRDGRPWLPEYIRQWLARHTPAENTGDLPEAHDGSGVCSHETAALSDMEQFRRQMRRFESPMFRLPWSVLSECLICRKVVPAEFRMDDGRVVLVTNCPQCGTRREAHYDCVFTARKPDWPGSACQTFGGSPIRPVVRGLPRIVRSLCPECGAIILGRYFAKDGAVYLEKTCPEHGYFQDKINSDVNLYLRWAHWSFDEGAGLLNPRVGGAHCPSDCGLCVQHQSTAVLANIDLTNRCNLTCPVCFANANASGFVYEPTYEQVCKMLQQLLDIRPAPCTSIQFSGGEPTVHPRYHDIIAAARDMGFTNIQVATNGLYYADLDFARASREAGLHTLYMQFDGLDDAVYRRLRGRPLLDLKLRAVENCRKVGLKICLVPTIVKGDNDDEVARIIQFAVDNIDVISAISFQPVVFTGRISRSDLAAKRYTLGDLAHDIAAATGADLERDFWPLSVVAPLSDLLSVLERKPKIKPSCHPDCAAGTYFFVKPAQYPNQPAAERLVPIPAVFDIAGLFTEMKRLADDLTRKRRLSLLDKLRVLWLFARHYRRDVAPEGLTLRRWLLSLQGMVDKRKSRGPEQARHYKTLMCAGMHFMDRYNYDAERVRRCVIHYSTPAGVFPFCTYNSGPCYREFVEAAFCVPKEQWLREHPPLSLVPDVLPERGKDAAAVAAGTPQEGIL